MMCTTLLEILNALVKESCAKAELPKNICNHALAGLRAAQSMAAPRRLLSPAFRCQSAMPVGACQPSYECPKLMLAPEFWNHTNKSPSGLIPSTWVEMAFGAWNIWVRPFLRMQKTRGAWSF
jgi:hypothetical protein